MTATTPASENSIEIPRFPTLLGSLSYWAETTPDALAVDSGPGAQLTYRELLENARKLAAAFVGLGLSKGDHIAIHLPSGREFVTAYFATGLMGGILTTLHLPYRNEELAPLMNFASARAVICAEVGAYDAPSAMLELSQSVETLDHVIAVSEPSPEDCLSFNGLLDSADLNLLPETPSQDTLNLLCFTSGTSAAPKGIVRDQQIMAENAVEFAKMLNMTPEDRVMIAPPLTHVFGLCCAGNAIASGATVLPLPVFSPEAYANMLTGMAPTLVYSAPAHLAATLKSGVLDAEPPASVRDVIVGGSICPPEVAAQFEAKLPNGRVGCLFGMTETLLTTQTDPASPAQVRHGTVGQLAKGLEARIIDQDGAQSQDGELQLSGYSVLAEYHDNPGANETAFAPDGWFRTGDLATLDADGNIIITGRVKDIINRGSIKINPSDIESLLDSHEAIIQSAIVPMPDEVLGERLCLYAVLKPGESLSLEDVRTFLTEHNVAKMRWPEHLEVIDEMPMTPTRKIIKSVLTADIRQKMEH